MTRFIIICAIVLMAAPVAAFAQAGSTGGTIGKVDKSASGGEVRVPANVMAGLDPAIQPPKLGVWMPGSGPGMTRKSFAVRLASLGAK